MTDTFKTITKKTNGLYKEKGSKFIALAFPVGDEEQIKDILAGLRKEYHDARHHCYAYMLGSKRLKYRANDDGEPSSSAGKPILGQINSFELTNVLIVVIRYFGGTKLGVSGLINAYRTAAREAIEDNQIVERTVNDEIIIHFEYPNLNAVMRIIKEEEPEIKLQKFEMECEMILSIRKSLTDKLIKRLEKVEGLSLDIEEGE